MVEHFKRCKTKSNSSASIEDKMTLQKPWLNLKPKYHIATPFVRSCATPEMGDSQPTLGLDATMMPQADVW
jgi:hypothetical protein